VQKQHTALEAQKKQHDELITKVNSYLSDFKPAFEPGSDAMGCFQKFTPKILLKKKLKN
jgi:hypothetical protein